MLSGKNAFRPTFGFHPRGGEEPSSPQPGLANAVPADDNLLPRTSQKPKICSSTDGT